MSDTFLSRTSFITALLICFAGSSGDLYAQAEAAEESRVAEIFAQRQAKTGKLAPEVNGGLERRLLFVKESKILERISGGIGGVRLKLGGLATNGGFALGPEYLRHNQSGRYQFRVAAQGSVKLFQKYDTEFNVSRFGRDRLFLDFYAVHHNYPELEFYGQGLIPGKRAAAIIGSMTRQSMETLAFDSCRICRSWPRPGMFDRRAHAHAG